VAFLRRSFARLPSGSPTAACDGQPILVEVVRHTVGEVREVQGLATAALDPRSNRIGRGVKLELDLLAELEIPEDMDPTLGHRVYEVLEQLDAVALPVDRPQSDQPSTELGHRGAQRAAKLRHARRGTRRDVHCHRVATLTATTQ